jgi:hypothetical protein
MGGLIIKAALSDTIAPDHSCIAIRVNSCPESAPKCLGSSSMVRRTSALRLRQKKQLVIMTHKVLTSSIVKVSFFFPALIHDPDT